jgi:hypothetical protein
VPQADSSDLSGASDEAGERALTQKNDGADRGPASRSWNDEWHIGVTAPRGYRVRAQSPDRHWNRPDPPRNWSSMAQPQCTVAINPLTPPHPTPLHPSIFIGKVCVRFMSTNGKTSLHCLKNCFLCNYKVCHIALLVAWSRSNRTRWMISDNISDEGVRQQLEVEHSAYATPTVLRMPSPGMLRRVDLVRTDVSEERRFFQDPHGVTSHKTTLFTVIAVR